MNRFFRQIVRQSSRPPGTRPRLRLDALEDRLQPANLSVFAASLCDSTGKILDSAAVGQLVSVRADFTVTGLATDGIYDVKCTIDGVSRSTTLMNSGAGAGSYYDNTLLSDWVVKSGAHSVTPADVHDDGGSC